MPFPFFPSTFFCRCGNNIAQTANMRFGAPVDEDFDHPPGNLFSDFDQFVIEHSLNRPT
jgi:hypothetical protein